MADGWTAIGYVDNCQACPTSVPPFDAEAARYLWRRCSASSNCCQTRLCVECCARWRAETEAGQRPTPYRISEIESTTAARNTFGGDRA